jgi:hypothetical protein
MRGAFWVSRGVFDHPLFRGEPFTQREAWLWLIAEAAWKPGRQRIGAFAFPTGCNSRRIAVACDRKCDRCAVSESRHSWST